MQGIISLVFGFITLILVMLGALAVWIFKIIKGPGRDKGGESTEEARIIQELHQQLTRMEERIESLETILLDRERKEER